MNCFKNLYSTLFFLCLFSHNLKVNAQSYGLIDQQIGHLDGYVLFSPLETKTTYLIDKCGNLVHSWASNYKPGQSVYLLPNGNLLRAINDSNTAFISGGGGIEKFDWNNQLLWSYKISTSLTCLHHDIFPMPNGNVLAILWEKKSREEAMAVGRNPDLLGKYVWNEKIIELKPKGLHDAEIVWQWDVWDHLVQDYNPKLPNYAEVNSHPEKININYKASKDEDWLHFNSVTYNEERNEILISNRNFSEIFIVKHSSKSSEIVFRWGNSAAYNSSTTQKQQLYLQHSAYWIPKDLKDGGKIILFNNGNSRPARQYSSVEIISPEMTSDGQYIMNENIKPNWIYADTSQFNFYSKNVSNAQVLQKGHVMICEGAKGKFFELDERQNIVWQFINPIGSKGIIKSGSLDETNRVFRCYFYPKHYKAFKRKKLKPLLNLKGELKILDCIPGDKGQ